MKVTKTFEITEEEELLIGIALTSYFMHLEKNEPEKVERIQKIKELLKSF
jgi:hypothetical protein